jgi:alpha-tubulin suppressor-like RCC1 family protein
MKMWLESLLELPRKAVAAAALALVFPAGNLMAQGGGSAGISAPFTIDAIFTSAASVPLSAPGFTASGKGVSLELRFAPPVGTVLTVVRNTSLELIAGTFDNLAQGQKTFLTYEGTSYAYVANYYGGSGNDLVLQPANTTCLSWGDTPNGATQSLNTGILAGKTIAQVAATSHTLILCTDGTLAALGSNSYGQLGDGTKTASTVPRLVSRSGVLKDKTVIAIATGWTFSVALCSDGTIATWGDNFFSSLGDGTTTSSNLPVEVVRSGVLAKRQVIAIAAGYYHVLGLCTDGTVIAWGRGANGQLGDSLHTNSTVPVEVNTGGVLRNKTVVAIGGGQIHSLALCSDGTLAAWGNNDYRQLGNGAESGSNYVPMPVNQAGVLAGKTVVSITCGSYHNFALCSDGTFVSWGSNSQGQLGIGLNGGYASLPTLVDRSGPIAGKTIASVAAGAFHSLATCTDGSMFFWGSLSAIVRFPAPSQESARSGGKAFIKAASAASSQLSVGFLAGPSPQPANIDRVSGSNQTTPILQGFPAPLVAVVWDQTRQPIGGVPVTFTAPDTGASARFGGNASITVITDANGRANSGALFANEINGTYTVTATYPGGSGAARFTLGNGSSLPAATLSTAPAGGYPVTGQTGSFDLAASVVNTTPRPLNGFRLFVDLSPYLAADPSLRLYNASSPPGTQPAYVDYPYPVPVGGLVSVSLSFHTRTRALPNPFAPALRTELLAASQLADTNGTGVQPRTITRVNGSVLIEFPSIPGRWYRVRYSSDMQQWRDCPVPLQAAGTRLQWIDNGPPFTDVPPSAAPSRFYIVNQIITP